MTFIESAANYLQAEIDCGAEVPFELTSQGGRGRRMGTPLYRYRALTGAFIAEREGALEHLPGHAEAARLLEGFDGLDRYLANTRTDVGRLGAPARVRAAISVLLADVFEERTDFELRPERLRAALGRLEQAAFAGANDVTLLATLHGVTIASAELPLTAGLTIARPDALREVPDGEWVGEGDHKDDHLIIVFALREGENEAAAAEDGAGAAIARGREVLKDLLRALRLFGDGRVTLGALAWARVGAGPWHPLPLGTGGRPQGMLVVTVDQEDQLRAFCNLVSRRAPHGNELAWALRRFELGCERDSPYEALSDHLLALRALLEPEGPSSGLLAGRLAALCATPEHRVELTQRIVDAVELERAWISGVQAKRARAAGHTLAKDVSDHLRALLADVICGHLAPDLAMQADELLAEHEASEEKALPEDASILVEAR
jgi:hypothetical protein